MTKIGWRALWLVFLFPLVAPKIAKPHIIAIVLDDLGWNDVGFHGTDQIKTPNIDALAYSGMILQRHYVLPTCTPSRTALLTGTHPIRSGMQGYPLRGGENRNVPISFKLMPSHLKDLGYRTHMVGKWHVGYQTYYHVPNRRGFDTFLGYYNGCVDYYNYYYNQSLKSQGSEASFNGYDMHYNDGIYRTNEPTYATKLFTERALEVLRRHNESEPLFLYLSHLAPHTGNERDGVQVPEDANVDVTYSYIKDHGRRKFAGCLEDLDKSVGIVVEELERKGMLANSIVLVISDNGGHTVSTDMLPNWSSNWPLAGIKFTLFEGGVRGTALLWSPLLPKGFVNDDFMHITDWLPTFYSAAGGNIKNLGIIDGKDQWEALKNAKTVKRDHLLININERFGSEGIIVKERWKLVKGGFPGYGNYELYWGNYENLASNPPYNITKIKNSKAGTSIGHLPDYDVVFEPKRIFQMRNKATLACQSPNSAAAKDDGLVPGTDKHRCPDFCLFDLINDPCELESVQNEEILKIGKRYLEGYKKKLMPQKRSIIDPKSDPTNFGDVWMPWESAVCPKSKAMKPAAQYIVAYFLLVSFLYYFSKIQISIPRR